MKLLHLFVVAFSFSAVFGQSNLSVFNNGGQPFYLIMNGIKQNDAPQTNVAVSGIKNGGYSVKLIFSDGKTPDIDKNFFLDEASDITTKIVFKKGKGKLQLVSMVPASGVVQQEAIVFRPDNNQVQSVNNQQNLNVNSTQQVTSSQQVHQQGTSNTSTGVNSNSTGNVGMNVQFNANANGTSTQDSESVGMNIQVTGNGVDPTLQNGNVGMNIQVSGSGSPSQQVISGSSNGASGTTNTSGNVGMNVQFNANANGTSTQESESIGMNIQVTGNGIDPAMQNGNVGMNVQVSGIGSSSQNSASQPQNGNVNMQMNINASGQTQNTMPGNVNMQVNVTETQTSSSSQSTTIQNGTVISHSSSGSQHNTSNQFGGNQQTSVQTTVNTNSSSACNTTLSDFDGFFADLKSQTFEDDKLETITKDLMTKCLYHQQAYKIIESLTFEENRFEIAKFLYVRTLDKQLSEKGHLNLFTFESTKMEWREFVRTTK
ncbi:MAG: DUF4476 domain-containing protein [Crocinitomicaceae bacterium]